MLTDRGSATIFVVIGLALVLFAGSTVAALSGLVVAHRRAQSAADLAAIAGAEAVGTSRDPCAAAASVAARNAATVEACEVTAGAVTLTVTVPGPALIGSVIRPSAVARAGR